MNKFKVIWLIALFLLFFNFVSAAIIDNNTGGDCEEVGFGLWNPETKTCTLVTDLHYGVEIDSSYITLDCNGHQIKGGGGGWGVFTYNYYREHLTIKNCVISGFDRGISLKRSSYSSFINNEIYSNGAGIYTYVSSNLSISNNKIYSNSGNGIEGSRLSRSNIYNNSIHHNGGMGIYFEYGQYANIFDNNIFSNGEGIFLDLGTWGPPSTYDTHNRIYRNNIKNNQLGVFVYTYSIGYISPTFVYHNNFTDNDTQFVKQGSLGIVASDNNIGNYWSDYIGTDLDSDGVGETHLPWQTIDNYPLMVPYGGYPCLNGVKDSDETDVDCGGLICPACEEKKNCLANEDCISGYCNINNFCVMPGDLYIEWIKPIQVIEDVNLVAGKATVVRVKVVNNGPEPEGKIDVALNYGDGCWTETKPVLMRAFSSTVVDFYPPNNCTK